MNGHSQPLVSIVIPVYNQRGDFLRECLNSAINQTYVNKEIVVSDNHSNNETVAILNEFSGKGIKIVRPFQHLDIVDHFHFAGGAAAGEFISFLSSDDLLYPECIAKTVQPMIENSNVSLAYCENEIIGERGQRKFLVRKLKLASGIYPRQKIAYRMYNCSEYWVIGGVMRSEQFKMLPVIKKIRAADWIWGLQILKYGDVAYCNEVLSAIRFHERVGNAKADYAEAHVVHNLQRAARHDFIIGDPELLKAIGLSKQQAVAYRDEEILGSVITILREYHNHKISKETIARIFGEFKKIRSGFNFNLLTRYYATKPALFYTYVLGVAGRIKKTFSPKK